VDLFPKQIPLLRATKVGRQLCRFVVKPVEFWGDRPILRAPPEAHEAIKGICGKPYKLPALKHAWLTATVVGVAKGMLSTGEMSQLPVLADALEEAGCDNADILDHCRSEGVHVSGCWVIDLLVGQRTGGRLWSFLRSLAP
jgi:hypothetical protein